MYYNVDEVKKFTEELENYEFFTEEDVDDFISRLNKKDLPDFDWETGATKLILIPFEKEDYVIKIPFTGYYTDLGDYFPFENAECDDGDNYCEAEINLYKEAVEKGFEKMFLKIEHVLTIGGHPVYVQPYCEMYMFDNSVQKSYSSNQSKEMVKKMKQSNTTPSIFQRLSLEWIASCIDVLGSLKRLYDFIDWLDWFACGADLHYGNVGYCNGHAIIVDYGGYRENDYDE